MYQRVKRFSSSRFMSPNRPPFGLVASVPMLSLERVSRQVKSLLLCSSLCLLSACGSEKKLEADSQLTGIGSCISGHMVNQCLNRRVCRTACTTAGGVAGAASSGGLGAAAGIAAGSQVCSEVCDFVPECSDVFICDRYERGGP